MPSSAHAPAMSEQLAQTCLTLLRIPSVTGQEAAIADHLHTWARRLPKLSPDDIQRVGNALVLGNPDEQRPCIALVGHLDTVPSPDGHVNATQVGDKITGLGASDMKGSIAVMQQLYETLELDNLPFALMLVLYDKEEGPFRENGLQPLLDQVDPLREVDFAIAMEPTDNTLQLGCLGGLQAKLTFRGQAAHSARPWQGENAIHKAGPFLTSLLNRGYPEVNVEGLPFREAVSVTLAEGGRARNVVPDKFELNVNYRFAPHGTVAQSTDAAVQELKRLAQGAEVEILDISPPGPIPLQNPILEHFQALADLPVQPKQAWTDVARLAAHGIDAVNYGPGMGAQAHQAGEWISLDAMVRAYETLAHVLSTPLSVT